MLTFNNLEGTISRHVRIPTRLVSVDLAVHQRSSSPGSGEPRTPSTVGCLQAAQQASAVKALRSHVLDRAGRTLEGLATSLGSSAPRYGRSLAAAAFPQVLGTTVLQTEKEGGTAIDWQTDPQSDPDHGSGEFFVACTAHLRRGAGSVSTQRTVPCRRGY